MSKETTSITKEQIETWKKEHGVKELIRIKVEFEKDDFAIAYFKPLVSIKNLRVTYNKVVTMLKNNQSIDAGEFVMKSTWVGGDERVYDDKVILKSSQLILENIDVAEGESERV